MLNELWCILYVIGADEIVKQHVLFTEAKIK